MNLKEGAQFVGAFVSFPIGAKARHVDILRSFLSLEENLAAKRIRFGPIRGNLKSLSFDEQKLQTALASLESGESDYLQLLNYKIGEDWIRACETSVSVDWNSSVLNPVNRTRSPVEERFSDAGSIRIGYPKSRFLVGSESSFQKKLLDLLTTLWKEKNLNWAFVHMGFHQLHPYSIGQDDVFRATRDGFPLTAFDHNLATPIGLYKEHVGGAFWANFLNSSHVSRLGGTKRILQEKPCKIVEPLDKDGILLQVDASPIPSDISGSVPKYQRLRRFLAPILMETGEDMMKIQKEIIGSWKPPRNAERKWQEDLAMIRKQYP
jgi:Protein of unknown function (DUF3396)